MFTGAGYGFKQIRLLVWCLISSEIPNIQTKPMDFLCKDGARKIMNKLKDLETAMVDCSGSEELPSPLQLPCVEIGKASWDQKSLQQKGEEVRWALKVLLDSVGSVKTQTKLSCQSSLLKTLETSVRNLLLIVNKLDLVVETAVLDPEPDCPSRQSQSLTKVLQLYDNLLQGKLELLSQDLKHSRCSSDSR
ncbi:hypothetical protein UPYG_G00202420 [Umbra pygmaea]|uniref:Leptin n=1 Tax=Umbra pygmaea TaxID=75934 RepID=A0ABD0X929_UMBPY